MPRSLRTFFAALLFMAAPVWAAEVAPDVLARNTTNEVIQIVKQDRDLKGGNSKKIHDLVEAKILPHFDFARMTRLAVGKNWNKATPEQQTALIGEFRTLLVRTYAASIASVSDYKIDFKPLRARPGDDDVMVNTEVSKPGAPPITIDYRMEKLDKGWKVYDVLVDNVSLVTVYRGSFDSEVRRRGIEGLIDVLVKRNQRPAA